MSANTVNSGSRRNSGQQCPAVKLAHLMSTTAQAQPNIALIKYWGKRDQDLNLPAVPSLSITLASLWTRTTVDFRADLSADHFTLDGTQNPAQTARVSACLDLLRQQVGDQRRAMVESTNNFPTAAGLASSASGFAALFGAASRALGLQLKDTELSCLARRASGSAARSIYGGFVEMPIDTTAEDTARPLLAAAEWPLEVVIAITSGAPKTVGSTSGMQHTAASSHFYDRWVEMAAVDFAAAREAVLAHNFAALARASERSCLKMHAVMLSADPPLVYWRSATLAAIQLVRDLRRDGVPVFFTVDAGPQVKAVCLPGATATVAAALADLPGVENTLTSRLGEGVRILEPACAK